MPFELAQPSFRSSLHAQWSVVLDLLEIPWAYESATFTAGDGRTFTPAFWLPRERLWLDAHESQADHLADGWLGRWRQFAAACSETLYAETHQNLHPAESTAPVEVPEEWHGTALLALGPIPSYSYNRPGDLWHAHHHGGMYALDDDHHQWAICPACGQPNAAAFGDPAELPCGCVADSDDSHYAVDPRLLDAYAAAAVEPLYPTADVTRVGGWPAGHRVYRTALVRQTGAVLATERCTRNCRSLTQVLRDEAPADAWIETGTGDTLCGSCPGFVCTACGERPAPADGAQCRVCDPVFLLTDAVGRQHLNDLAAALSRLLRQPLRVIHPQLNQAMGVRRRWEADLEDLVVGINQAEQWVADPSTMVIPAPVLREEEIALLDVMEARAEIAVRVGRLSTAVGEVIPFVQIRINESVGAPTREDMDQEQAREALRQVQQWLRSPGTYHQPTAPAVQEPPADWVPGVLPAPEATRAAAEGATCDLCADPVPRGALLGRLPRPRSQQGVRLGWLCGHCLNDRRLKPRRRDLLLRIFHAVFLGSGIRLNVYEAQVMATWLEETSGQADGQPPAGASELAGITARLREVVAAEHGTMLSRLAGLSVVQHLRADAGATTTLEREFLHAVAQHFQEWSSGGSAAADGPLWAGRREILGQTARPTVLSVRGGPFAL
ncbi:hypothetical protein ABT095_14220 [Kitasatospora sp. NPDC002227]|uniref:hypothetical protein n=1 Tax=Kitasatospora sp. NPDC002227 TaxID=3154773 RepID=UPI003323FBDC